MKESVISSVPRRRHKDPASAAELWMPNARVQTSQRVSRNWIPRQRQVLRQRSLHSLKGTLCTV